MSTATQVQKTELEADAIGLGGATMQAITHIAPAIAGFFFTAHAHEKLFARAKDSYDGAQPSGNGVAASCAGAGWHC